MQRLLFFLVLMNGLMAQEHRYVFPHFTFKDGIWETTINLYNPTPVPADIHVQAYDAAGQPIGGGDFSIAPLGLLHEKVNVLLPGLSAQTGWLDIGSEIEELKGMMTFSAVSSGGTSSLNLETDAALRLVFPDLETGVGVSSGFALVNPSDQTARVDLSLYAPDGTHWQTLRVNLTARGKLVTMLTDLFDQVPPVAVLKATSSVAVFGFGLNFLGGLDQIVAVPGQRLSQISAPAEVLQELQELLEDLIEPFGEAPIKGALLQVQAPDLGIDFKGAAGEAAPGTPMQTGQFFRLASIGKAKTAVAVVNMVERGLVDLTGGLRQYVDTEVTDGLHVFEGVHYGPELTLNDLLHHTSGLQDHFFDGDANYDGYPDFFFMLLTQPNTFWEPMEVLDYAKTHLAPIARPGEVFHYSDTGFLLAALVLESVSGQTYHEVCRSLIFDPLNMNDTFLEFREPLPSGLPMAHTYFYDLDYTDFQSVSADWGGGGQVSTLEDLDAFLEAVIRGEVFENPQSLDLMQSWVPADGGWYGLGLEKVSLGSGRTIIGHNGFSGAFMYYWVERNVRFTGTVNQAVCDSYAVVDSVISTILGE